MSNEGLKTPFIDAEMARLNSLRQEQKAKQEQQEREQPEIIAATPRIRDRIGTFIRSKIPFPQEINGRKIKPAKFNQDKTDVVVGTGRFSFVTYRLQPMSLTCQTVNDEGKDVAVTIESSAYPFANWKNSGQQRDVDLRLDIFGYAVEFGGVEAFVKQDHDYKRDSPTLAQLKMVDEVLGLLEKGDLAKTKIEIKPPAFARI